MQRVQVMDTCGGWTVNRNVTCTSKRRSTNFYYHLCKWTVIPAIEQPLVQLCWWQPHMPWKWKNGSASKTASRWLNIAVRWLGDNQTTATTNKFRSIIPSRRYVYQFGQPFSHGNTGRDDILNFDGHMPNNILPDSCFEAHFNFMNWTMSNECLWVFHQCNLQLLPCCLAFWSQLEMMRKMQQWGCAKVYCHNSLHYENMLKKSGHLCIRLNLIRLVAISMLNCMNVIDTYWISM